MTEIPASSEAKSAADGQSPELAATGSGSGPAPSPSELDGPSSAWFLGPKSEQSAAWRTMLDYVLLDYLHWRRNYFPNDPLVIGHQHRLAQAPWLDTLNETLDELLSRLKADVPFFHPRYLAHMTSETTLPSVLGYFAGMLYNANNVTDEAAPVTVSLELDVARMVATMVGYRPDRAWAHVTSGGTIANVEALWLARQAQFVPLALRDLCIERKWAFDVPLPDGRAMPISEMPDQQAIALRPRDALRLPLQLARYLRDELSVDAEVIDGSIKQALFDSDWSPAKVGFGRVAAKLGRWPQILAPGTCHYSIKKAANVLGYGEDSVRLLPVDDRFRLSIDDLTEVLLNTAAENYVAAVIGVVGTTEEGAVDPIHEILAVRRELEQRACRSFWLHADAAWGGYVASIFRGLDLPAAPDVELEAIFEALHMKETVSLKIRNQQTVERVATMGDHDVVRAFMKLGEADSITVDPHKLGYVPYPAGIVAFRDVEVTQLVKQEAPYIGQIGGATRTDEGRPRITNVGPYSLEGSRPGAAAAACWLAHRSIALNATGHGRVIRSTMMSARRLAIYLELHDQIYLELEDEFADDRGDAAFTFQTLAPPDTNLVCFVARPMRLLDRQLRRVDVTLARLNSFNENIHQVVSRPPGPIGATTPHAHPYYVSRSDLDEERYPAKRIGPLLERLGVDRREYQAQGLFVLRSTVMNPGYRLAAGRTGGVDYLLEFVKHLHAVARRFV